MADLDRRRILVVDDEERMVRFIPEHALEMV